MINKLPADVQNLGLTDRVVLEAKQFAFYNYCSAANNADFDNLETWPYAAQVAYYSICNYMSGNPICWPYSTKTIPMDLKDAAFETALQQWKEQKEVVPIKDDNICGMCKERPKGEGITVCDECYQSFDGDRRGFWNSEDIH